MESPRASFPSSSRSSFFSSLDCNKTAQHKSVSFDRAIYPETSSRDPAMSQSGASPQFRRQSLDLGDGDKASVCREARRLSVKTTFKEELKDCEQTLPADLKESLRVLAKLRETTRCIDEDSRSSCETKDRSLFSFQKDARRYSYDGSDLGRLSFGSWDAFKSTPKLNEFPRLSLDSRVGSMRSLNSDSKSISGAHTRPPSVVAKLMGLETLPDADLARDHQLWFIKTCPVEDFDPFSSSLKSTDPCLSIQTSNSLGNLWKEPVSLRWRKPESVMKSSSMVPIEPAPWKQLDRSWGSHKSPLKRLETPGRETNISLLLIAKGLLETRRDEQDSNPATRKDHRPRYKSPHISARLVNQQKPHSDHVNHSTNKGANSLRTSESPIVIMRPGKFVEKSSILVSSVIPVDCLSGLPKLQCQYADSSKSLVNRRTSKEQIPKTCYRENTATSNDNRKTINRTLNSTETSPRALLSPKENTISSVKSSGSVSPRLQQKKLELEKRSRPHIPSDSSRSRRQANKQQQESDSPGGKHRPKSAKSQQSDGYFVMDLRIDTEVTSAECCAEANGCWSPSMKAAKYLVSGLKLAPRLSEVGAAEFASVALEHPSPVSVLDDTMYKDDAMSPVKQMPDALKDEGTVHSKDNSSREQWDSAENLVPKFPPPGPQLNPDNLSAPPVWPPNQPRVILVGFGGDFPEPWLKLKKSLNAQKLLREMCSEIDQRQAKKSDFGLLEDEDDWLKRILWENLVHRPESWTDFHSEISGMSLDVERLIFTDLVGEIVHGEAASLRTKPDRHCRRIFA
ncbi:hypothetical protein Acr_26g0002690 [Actinidia rufa]|uniref:Uncharacterized protein n=1 Tax=Actinidia rufa TaxID=165716 RepID=A0A7J0H1M5_9ERIC|nr:hypothetical protein Acr_26g0002690 [Actinidia rufa]